jgi:CRISPR-associated endonuclease/helicase Cas3
VDYIYFAKTKPVEQTISEHTQEVLKHYEEFKEKNPSLLDDCLWVILRLAVVYHDLGKANAKFQNKLYAKLGKKPFLIDYSKQEEIPHGYLSCAFININEVIEKYGLEACNVLCKAIYYHHDRKNIEPAVIKEYILKYLKSDIEHFEYPMLKDFKVLNYQFLKLVGIKDLQGGSSLYKKYVMVKGFLNRMDYAASAGMEKMEENTEDSEGFSVADRVNMEYPSLREVQQYMKDNADKNVIVTATTGIGKTEAALLWIGSGKGFYTLPLKVSVNAIFDRVENKLGYKKACLLHSDALSYYINEEKESIDNEQVALKHTRAKQLSAPLIFCTVDQIFKFVFRHNGCEHVLATLSYSKVVVDEIQMYSPEMVAILLAGIKTISEFGGRVAIITATFPPVLYHLMDKHRISYELPKKVYHNPLTPKRHKIRFIKEREFDYDLIIEKGRSKKVLVLVNTVIQAQKVYEKLKNEGKGLYVKLLHSRFIKKHRKALENAVLDFAPNSPKKDCRPGIWISTQIVEASLDIDFDVLFTEMCTIDSLLQRMGRVFRNRIFEGEEPNVYIYDTKNGVGRKNVIDPDLYDFSVSVVEVYDGKILMETDEQDDKQVMINLVYDLKNNEKLKNTEYYKIVKEKLKTLLELYPFEMEKEKVDKAFRNIDSITVIPLPIYNALKQNGTIERWSEALEQSKNFIERQKVLTDIMDYTVSLSYWHDHRHRIRQRDLIYKDSGICLWDCDYYFSEAALEGVGIVHTSKKDEAQEPDNIF